MQTIQWTNEVIIACGVIVLACILLGYFIASLLQGRQLKLLAMQLEQGQATASAQQEALQEKLRAAEGRSHELQVIEGRLQAQLRADGAFLERTIAELQEYKKSAVGLGTKIEQQAQQHHDALTRLESALGDGRALRDRVADLDGRLAAAQKLCDALRDERGRLKDEVASEAGRAELAEASEREVREQLTVARKSLADQVQAFAALQDRYQPLSTEHAELKTSLQKREEHFQEQVTDLRQRLSALQELADELLLEGSRLKDELATEGKRAKGLETSEREVREQLADAKRTLAEHAQSYDELQALYQQLSTEHTELRTTLQRREEHFTEQMLQLADTRKSLTQEFENLANKIFEEKGKAFTHTSQASIDSLLKPFREQIEGFQKRVNEVHDASLQGNTSLNSEIRKVLDIGLQMSKEANNLASALKGNSQQRGAWGEAQLRRTLEMSGLVEEAHYEVQSAFKDAEGRQKQTDYLVKLPDGKHIIIDSKVSLVAYDRAVGAESPEEYQVAMGEHVKGVRKHIDDLAFKDYTNLVGMRSPSFVLMFMPIEPAYIEALKSNKDLFEYGYKKGIVLVSHTTLIPILRTVANLWMVERSNAEAREISEKAGDIYNQVCVVAERLSKLGGTLSTVSNHYNDTVRALGGKQGLYGKVERFTKLSAKVSKTLPQLEPAHMDFERERLSLIVESIDEPAERVESLEDHALTGLPHALAVQP